jgi:hypothetical protein
LLRSRAGSAPGCRSSLAFVSFEPAGAAAARLDPGRTTAHVGGCLLGDTAGNVSALFGLYAPSSELRAGFRQIGLDPSLLNGSHPRLPLVATYVINDDGIAVFAEIDADPCRRAEPEAVLATLRGERTTSATPL